MTQTSPNTLTLLSLNVNGLGCRINEIRDYLLENQIDLLLFQETKIPKSFSYNIPNYYLYRTDRPHTRGRYSGGTAIYVHSSISHSPVISNNTPTLEHTSVTIHTDNNNTLQVSSVYIKPGIPFPTQEITALLNNAPSSFLAGDLNSKHLNWNNCSNNRSGRALQNLISSTNFELIHPESPTHFSHGRPTTIDIALLNNIPYQITAETLEMFDSDHYPVLFTLDFAAFRSESAPKTYVDIHHFYYLLSNTPPRPSQTSRLLSNLKTSQITSQIPSKLPQNKLLNRLDHLKYISSLLKSEHKSGKEIVQGSYTSKTGIHY